jgi:threonine dehydrogenase-like Zn-dependent dehydrogenase
MLISRTIYSGAGPIGLVSLLSARAAGAEPIVITDLFQSRLDFAKKLVPGVRTVLIQRGTSPKAQAERIKAAAGGLLKLALECTGVENSVHTAVYVSIDRFVFTQTVMTVGAYSRCNSVERFSLLGWEKMNNW